MRLNITPKLLLIAMLAILFTSCSKWLENEFVPLPSYLYPAYEKGDTFLYKNIVTEDIDSFLVDQYILDTIFDGNITYERTVGLFIEIVGDTLGKDYFLASNEPSRAIFEWDSSFTVFDNFQVFLDTTMQGFDYSGLYLARGPRQDTISEKLYKVYYDLKYGLVKYTYNNLDSYELFRRPE